MLPTRLDLLLISKITGGGSQRDFQHPQDDLLNMEIYIPNVQNSSVFNPVIRVLAVK